MVAQRGGKRLGAGRPRGQGKFGEATKAIRLPISRIDEVMNFIQQGVSPKIPLYSSTVRAGFPSPADDYIENYLDLNEHFIAHPSSTFMVRAAGDSMTKAGIHSGDLLIVDRSLEASHGKIVIAAINGELTVKRLARTHGRVQLLPENEAYSPIDITDELDMVIWGVVTYVIHQAI